MEQTQVWFEMCPSPTVLYTQCVCYTLVDDMWMGYESLMCLYGPMKNARSIL